MYSSEVCSRNRLVLTNKDKAEYRSFEARVKTTSDFKCSTVMLFTFHGVWMAFKKYLLTLLEDCDCGKVYGKLVYCSINQLVHTKLYNYNNKKYRNPKHHQVKVWLNSQHLMAQRKNQNQDLRDLEDSFYQLTSWYIRIHLLHHTNCYIPNIFLTRYPTKHNTLQYVTNNPKSWG